MAAMEAPRAVTVLLAEDNITVRDLVERTLIRSGYEVLTTSDGREALELIKEKRPGIVILDWVMPGMQGSQVCALVKTDPETADIPVIMLTAKSAERDIEMGFEHGADEYLTKPFEIEELELMLRHFANRVGG
ncbi:MAG: response regulator [Actinomycetota bacterium]